MNVCEKYGIDLEKGFIYRGNLERIKACMRKAKEGTDITVGFLGGSITQGSLSSTPEKCYAYLVYQWWVKTFPNVKVSYVNAGVGGTTSQFGVARVERDLLSANPDFCVVEFSVNDENEDFYKETYEGLVRKMLSAKEDMGLMLVHNIYYQDGHSALQIHREVGTHYELPSVSIGDCIFSKIVEGVIPNREITPDDLHPNDNGHEIVSQIIINALEKIYDEVLVKEEKEKELPKPITQNRFENSTRYQSYNSNPMLQGFEIDQDNNLEHFHHGWKGKNKGDRIVFSIEATSIAIQYRKTIQRPTSVARVIVDHNDAFTQILDGNFEENWGDCLSIATIATNLEKKEHCIEIEIIEDHSDDKMPFYLLSVIGAIES